MIAADERMREQTSTSHRQPVAEDSSTSTTTKEIA